MRVTTGKNKHAHVSIFVYECGVVDLGDGMRLLRRLEKPTGNAKPT